MPLTGGWGLLLTHLGRIARLDEHLGERVDMGHIGEDIADRARDKLGTYQPAVGPLPAWLPLADATKAERAAAGFPADEPLLRTGDLRDSIDVTTMDRGKVVVVGIPDYAPAAEYAAVQEMGSASRGIPPRPFMGPALYEMEGDIVRELKDGAREGVKP